MNSKNVQLIQSVPILQETICQCRRCPRLVKWREKIASTKVARFQDYEYWGKPVPSFGKVGAQLLIVGLAPAAHGGNRTGRMFTGDRSGDWLYRSLYAHGFANQPVATDRGDGLELIDCYVTAVLHCAPPQNKPLPQEIINCRPYLIRELQLLRQAQAIIALGKLAFDQVWSLIHVDSPPRRPNFRHGLEIQLATGKTLIASFHPSQQNTFTGKLTAPMFDSIFDRARQLVQPHP